MNRVLILACLSLAVGSGWAQEAVQTDWSGGGGIGGPVTAWGDRFDTAVSVSCRSCPGQLALGSTALAPALSHFVTSSFAATSLAGGDVDGDGDPDIVGSSLQGTGRVGWWRNDDGAATAWTFMLIDGAFTGARGIQVGDIDGDGHLDVVGAGFNSEVAWWRNDGGEPINWEKRVIAIDFQGGNRLAVIDIEGDGDLDVIGVAYQIHDVRLWVNGGESVPTWTEVLIDGSCLGVVDVHAGDVDADGAPDVAAVAYDGDLVRWYRNLGGSPPAWEGQTIAGAFNGAHCVRIADIDNDGDGDIVAVAYFAHDVVWWRNDGGSPIVWTRKPIELNYTWASDVRTGDIDGDGDIDVIATGYDSGRMTWWENSGGAGETWVAHGVATGYAGAWPVEPVDMDCDGDLDLLSCASWAVSIDWWEVTRFTTEGHLTSSILDLGATPAQAEVDWDAVMPPSTQAGLRVRCGNDPLNMGPWSEALLVPGNLPDPLGRYVQYEVALESSDPLVSLLLREVALSWDLAADVHGGSPSPPTGLRLRPVGPARDADAIRLVISRPGRVRVELFDACGRRIGAMLDRWLAAGEHRMPAFALPSGAYLCRARSGGDECVCSLIVVR
jgi:hypothetical protein